MNTTAEALVIGFNRPSLLTGALHNLRELGIRRLFVALDGPRPQRPDDVEAVRACREVVETARTGGPIELLAQDENLGCRRGVSTAITWFLDQVGEGVIIEDDVRVSPAFLTYAADGLHRYRNEPRIGMISGYTPLAAPSDRPPSTHLTWFGGVWGWATWAENWASWPGPPATPALFDAAPLPVTSTLVRRRFTHGARMVEFGCDTWDYSWDITRVANGWLCATPAARMTTNVGFGVDATHTSRSTPAVPIELSEPDAALAHPTSLRPDLEVDEAIIRALDQWYGTVARRLPRRLRWRLIEVGTRTGLVAS